MNLDLSKLTTYQSAVMLDVYDAVRRFDERSPHKVFIGLRETVEDARLEQGFTYKYHVYRRQTKEILLTEETASAAGGPGDFKNLPSMPGKRKKRVNPQQSAPEVDTTQEEVGSK